MRRRSGGTVPPPQNANVSNSGDIRVNYSSNIRAKFGKDSGRNFFSLGQEVFKAGGNSGIYLFIYFNIFIQGSPLSNMLISRGAPEHMVKTFRHKSIKTFKYKRIHHDSDKPGKNVCAPRPPKNVTGPIILSYICSYGTALREGVTVALASKYKWIAWIRCRSHDVILDRTRVFPQCCYGAGSRTLCQYAVKPKRHSLRCHGFVVCELLLRMHMNVVDFRVMRRLCHREWNWQWNWQSVNHIPVIYDNGPRDHGVWRLTLTAYMRILHSHNTAITSQCKSAWFNSQVRQWF